MALAPDARIGQYQITVQIGAGGMGEVYRARDTNLERDVAIKVLPEAFSQDPERLARFEREAKTLAALNHPNIAQIYGLERSGSVTALVMELVEGQTLESNAPIPIDEALALAPRVETRRSETRRPDHGRRLSGEERLEHGRRAASHAG